MIIHTHRGSRRAVPAKAPVTPAPVAPITHEPQPSKKTIKKAETLPIVEEEIKIEDFLTEEEN